LFKLHRKYIYFLEFWYFFKFVKLCCHMLGIYMLNLLLFLRLMILKLFPLRILICQMFLFLYFSFKFYIFVNFNAFPCQEGLEHFRNSPWCVWDAKTLIHKKKIIIIPSILKFMHVLLIIDAILVFFMFIFVKK